MSKASLTLPELVANAEHILDRVHEQSRQLQGVHDGRIQDSRHDPNHPGMRRAAGQSKDGKEFEQKMVLQAGRDFIQHGMAHSDVQANLLNVISGAGKSTEESHDSLFRVMESLSGQHLHEFEHMSAELRALRLQYNELEQRYRDLQVSSAIQLKEISMRRDAILESLRAETAGRLSREAVLQQAVAVIQRLTGRKFSDLTAADMSLDLRNVSDQVVMQQAQISAEHRHKYRTRLRHLVSIDVLVRARWTQQNFLTAWCVARARGRFLLCQYARIASRRAKLIQAEAWTAWRLIQQVRVLQATKFGPGHRKAHQLAALKPRKKMLLVIQEWTRITKYRRLTLRKCLKGVLRTRKNTTQRVLRGWHMSTRVEIVLGTKGKQIMRKVLCGTQRRLFMRWLELRVERRRKHARLLNLLRVRMLGGARKFFEIWKLQVRKGRRTAKGMSMLDVARYRKIIGNAFAIWLRGVAVLLGKLRLRVRCVSKVLLMRKRHVFKGWLLRSLVLRYLQLEALKLSDDSDVQQSLSAVSNLTADLHSKDQALAQLRRSLKLREDETSMLSAKVARLEEELASLHSGAQAAAFALQDAVSHVAAEQGADSAKLMALHKRALELEALLRAANMRCARLESILVKFGTPAARHCLEKLNASPHPERTVGS